MNEGAPKAAKHPTGNRNKSANGSPPPFQFIPKWRMSFRFPWPVWAIGWLAIFKGVIWLATDPTIPSPTAEMLAAKFIVGLVPYVIFGIGVWNFRRWAVWGLVAVSTVDLLYFLSLGAYMPFYELLRYIAGKHFFAIQLLLMVFNGPLGNILILIATPILLKYSGKNLPSDVAEAALHNAE